MDASARRLLRRVPIYPQPGSPTSIRATIRVERGARLNAHYVQEYRPSGPVITPRMHCYFSQARTLFGEAVQGFALWPSTAAGCCMGLFSIFLVEALGPPATTCRADQSGGNHQRRTVDDDRHHDCVRLPAPAFVRDPGRRRFSEAVCRCCCGKAKRARGLPKCHGDLPISRKDTAKVYAGFAREVKPPEPQRAICIHVCGAVIQTQFTSSDQTQSASRRSARVKQTAIAGVRSGT